MIKGDKIRLTKQMGAFTNVGEICEVIKVDEDGVISFRFGNNGQHLGCMSYNEFEKYFELVKEKNKKRKWSSWKLEHLMYESFDHKKHHYAVFYRENGKKVQIKYPFNNIRSEATCCKKDRFDFNKGFELAKKRILVKILEKEVEKFAKSM